MMLSQRYKPNLILWGGLALVVILLAILPAFVGRFTIFIFYILFVNIALAQSWNLVGGYTGLISLGHAAFFGIGAYVAAVAMSIVGMKFIPSIFAGGITAALFSVLISFPTFRFRGVYFSIGTLILAEALRIWMINWELTGGAQGMRFPIGSGPGLNGFYWLMLGMAIATTFLLVAILETKLGVGLRAIRDNEESARNTGVNVFQTKLYAFVISAFIAGLVGSTHAVRMSVIEPYSIYSVTWTIAMINIVIIGGMGTIIGPLVGAIFITFLGEMLADYYAYHLILTGVIFIIVIRFMPAGIWGTFIQSTWAKKFTSVFSADMQAHG